MQNIRYSHEDMGMLIGFLSIPYTNTINFEEKVLKPMFEAYKKTLVENCCEDWADDYFNGEEKQKFDDAQRQMRNGLYIPKTFCMMGRWDLAVFSLIDDYEFGVHFFQPFSPTKGGNKPNDENAEQEKSFHYQTLTAVFPRVSKNENGNTTPYNFFVDDAKESTNSNRKYHIDFYKKGKSTGLLKYPLIGICSLKINNSLLIGGSEDVYKQILFKLRDTTNKASDGEMYVVLLEGTSWHELELLVFGNCYAAISTVIDAAKNMMLNDVADSDECKQQIQANTLIGKCSTGNLECDKIQVFSKAVVNLGFDFELLKALKLKNDASKQKLTFNDTKVKIKNFCTQKKVTIEDEPKDMSLLQRWFTKPGYQETVIKKLTERGDGVDIQNFTYGPGEFAVVRKEISSLDTVAQIVYSIYIDEIDQELSSLVTHTLSIPEVKKAGERTLREHTGLHAERLRYLQFEQSLFDKLRTYFLEIGASKVLTTKVFNLFANFNEGIRDPVMYIYFLELRPALERLYGYIMVYAETLKQHTSLRHFHTELSIAIDEIETAYYNRFQHSHTLAEVSDFNLEFKGGIHQIVSAYDALYKVYCDKLGLPGGFLYVSASPTITSTPLAVKVNYHHLYQPEIFLCIAAHEAANHNTWRNIDFDCAEDLTNIHSSYTKVFAEDITTRYASQLAHYFWVDSITYLSSYRRDFEGFVTWQLHNILQIKDSYLHLSEIDPITLKMFSIRMLLVECAVNSYQLTPENSIVVKVLENSQAANEQIVGYVKKVIDGKFKTQNDEKQTSLSVTKVFGYLRSKIDYQLVNTSVENSSETANISLDLKSVAANFSKDSYNMLQIVSEECKRFALDKTLKLKDMPCVLSRNISDGAINMKATKKLKSDILFDPRGGMFKLKPHIRRAHLKRSTELMKYLWHSGNILKQEYVKPFIEKKYKTESEFYESHIRSYSVSCFLSCSGKHGATINADLQKVSNKLGFGLSIYFFNDKTSDVILTPIKEDLQNRITEVAIRNGIFFIEYSRESLASPFCLWEIYQIYRSTNANSVKIIPILHKDDKPSGRLPDSIDIAIAALNRRLKDNDKAKYDFLNDLMDQKGKLNSDFSNFLKLFDKRIHDVSRDEYVPMDESYIAGLVEKINNIQS